MAPSATVALSPASVPTSSLFLQDPPFVSRSRPKHERWRDESSPPASLDNPALMKNLEVSFRDVLLAKRPSTLLVSSVAVGTAATAPADLPAPRNLATMVSCRAAPVMSAKQGWQKVESKGTRRRWVKVARPRRSVSADLSRLCFNCFLTSHRAAQCRLRARCFRCCALGHHSIECKELCGGGDFKFMKQSSSIGRRPVMSVMVWRPKVQDN
jgi:hypothetical protein